MTRAPGLPETVKTGLKVALSLLIALAIVPILALAGWFGRFFFLAAVPVAVLAVLLSPRVRLWLLGEAEEEPGEAEVFMARYKGLELLSDVALHPHHAWARRGACGELTVGVDSLLGRALGPVSDVHLPQVGQEVVEGQPVMRVRSGNRTLDVLAPAAGKVMWLNGRLRTDPGLLNRAPYTKGWTLVLWPRGPRARVEHLRTGDNALSWFRAEVDRLLAHVAPAELPGGLQGATLQDGGPLAEDLHLHLDARTWGDVRRSFFGQEDDGPGA